MVPTPYSRASFESKVKEGDLVLFHLADGNELAAFFHGTQGRENSSPWAWLSPSKKIPTDKPGVYGCVSCFGINDGVIAEDCRVTHYEVLLPKESAPGSTDRASAAARAYCQPPKPED